MSRIAYLVSQYPAPSHTFIRREIAALRSAGMMIAPFTIRPGSGAGAPLGEAALSETEAVLGRSSGAYPAATAVALFKRPGRWIATLALALRHRPPGARSLLWSLFHFVEAMVLARLLERAGATRLHVHFANSGASVGLLAARFLGLPYSLTLHGISETDYPSGLLLADKVANAEFVACASWFMRAQAMRQVRPSQWGKLHVVRCGFDPRALPPTPKAEESSPVQFICAGRLSSEKGQYGLLDAFAQTLSSGLRAKLELVGDGPERSQLESEAARLHLAETVRFSGALPEDETLARIAAADILVIPSFMEGLPMVLIEALALGKPVIASAVAGIPEVIVHNENGLLVRAGDNAAMARAMALLARDPALRRRLGAAGAQAVATEFAIDHAVIPLRRLLAGGVA